MAMPIDDIDLLKRQIDAAEERRKTSKVQVIRHSIFTLQVCAPDDMTMIQVEEETNLIMISGTEEGWRIRAGSVICANNPKRLHWLFDC